MSSFDYHRQVFIAGIIHSACLYKLVPLVRPLLHFGGLIATPIFEHLRFINNYDMIHPVDVPVLFAERRQYLTSEIVESPSPLRRNAYGQCTSSAKLSRRVLPQVVLERGLALWGNLFKETSRFPVAIDERNEKDSQIRADRLIFPDPVEPPTKKSPLELKLADLHIERNSISHHTVDFNIVQRDKDKKLVVRRGQPFEISVSFYRDVDYEVDELKLVFEIGPQPTVANSTKVVIILPLQEGSNNRSAELWYAKVTKLEGKQLTIQINISPNCIVGRWNLKVVTYLKAAPRNEYLNSTSLISDVYVLFNPWNKNDMVFMPSEDLDEYVLNDVGKIWRGSHSALRPCYWSFGQFEDGILEAVMNVLSRSSLPFPLCSNPIMVVRAMADMVQSPEGYSILEGDWAADYFTGTAPTEWTGSSRILQQYTKTGRQISYGHCWVFAGVMTTILRCLGIPTRIVTCYQAAHDSDKFVAVDIHVERNGKLNKEGTQDKIWAFHVWNECWMKRPDLPSSYSGWQVVDATPQEKGDGITRVGPAPVRAIKEGRLDIAYDTTNVISEVNAYKCYWVEDESGEEKLVEVVNEAIGLCISTKKPGRIFTGMNNNDRLDITNQYKMSQESRDEVFNSLLPGHKAMISRYLMQKQSEDVKFLFTMDDDVMLGEDFHFEIVLTNLSDENRDINLSLRIESVHFSGRGNIKIKQEQILLTIPPGRNHKYSSILHLNDYLSRSAGQFSFTAVVSDALKVGKSSEVGLQFSNPLPISLTGCKFIIEGPGIVETLEVPCKKVSPRAIAKARCSVQPWRHGHDRILIAHFSSDQLKDVDAAIAVDVNN
ncbi:Annulin [Trichinella britovi]|uniref:Annulin n=1 Tax=Trichinella britovi TaxID=45882 RepID=A0A0V1CEG8_TRIBR|nr:Annulin [Trichinella britovi]